MELDRDFIERTDFPQVRRGYDPDAVDRHLADIAQEAEDMQRTVEDLRREQSQGTAPQTVSGAAAEQVRVIVEAAEQSAATIETRAREEADRRGREAERRARELAGVTEGRIETLATRVDQVTDLLLRRVDSVESELSTLREGARSLATALDGLGDRTGPLRSEIEGMRAGVQELRDDPDAALGEARGAAGSSRPTSGGRSAAAEPAVVGGPEPDLADEPEPVTETDLAPERTLEDRPGAGGPGRGGRLAAVASPEPRGAEEEIAPVASEEPAVLAEEDRADEAAVAAEEADLTEAELELEREEELAAEEAEPEDQDLAAEPGASDEEEEGARLVALNMALNGVPRNETDRYLADNFDLRDRSTVLDDVYARVGEA